MAKQITLYGRIVIRGDIRLLSGLHIGGAAGALAIGNLDLPVIRNPMNGRPYIPGSSLKGKMRSLSEKLTGAPQNAKIGKDVFIHVAETKDEYADYWVNPVFGVPAPTAERKYDVPYPNRLIVRDVHLSDNSAAALDAAKTDLPYTEIKWEAAIDRVTSAATPRQIERVPAGAVFTPMELVFSIYETADFALFKHVLTALQLVEDDYLGGQGSRGSGKVAFEGLKVSTKAGANYSDASSKVFANLAALTADNALTDWLTTQISVPLPIAP